MDARSLNCPKILVTELFNVIFLYDNRIDYVNITAEGDHD
jgi:hypothetical protein